VFRERDEAIARRQIGTFSRCLVRGIRSSKLTSGSPQFKTNLGRVLRDLRSRSLAVDSCSPVLLDQDLVQRAHDAAASHTAKGREVIASKRVSYSDSHATNTMCDVPVEASGF